MAGNDGNDFIDAGPGDDAIEVYQLGEEPDDGSGGDDRILGGPGNDGIHALHGRDVVDAGAGNDRIYSLDELWQIKGPSKVTCGAGADQFGPERGDVVSGCEQLYELWPPHLPLCGPCTLKLQAKIGSRLSFLTQLRMVLTKEKSWTLIPIGKRARALVQARGTLQVRVLYGSGTGPLFAREWFTLRR
jgi:hypothetical protein